MLKYLARLSFVFLAFMLLTAQAPSPWAADELIGKKAPDFVLKDINGRDLSLSSLRGKPVIINFWATWCPPCKAEMPSLNRLYGEFKAKGLAVLAISTDRNATVVREYLSTHPFDFMLLIDPEGKISRQYKVFSIPTSFLIDKNGVIVQKYLGEEEWDSAAIKNKIKELL